MKLLPNECFFAWVEEELARTGSVRFRVKGVSMYPLLRNGCDEVEVRSVDPATVRPGDILLFRYRGRHVLHRLMRQAGVTYYLRGDNAWSEERCVGKDFVGRVEIVYRCRKKIGKVARCKAVAPHSLRWCCVVWLWRLYVALKRRVWSIMGHKNYRL